MLMGALLKSKSWPESPWARWTDGGLPLPSIGWRLHTKDGTYSLTWVRNHLCPHRKSKTDPLVYNAATITSHTQKY